MLCNFLQQRHEGSKKRRFCHEGTKTQRKKEFASKETLVNLVPYWQKKENLVP